MRGARKDEWEKLLKLVEEQLAEIGADAGIATQLVEICERQDVTVEALIEWIGLRDPRLVTVKTWRAAAPKLRRKDTGE